MRLNEHSTQHISLTRSALVAVTHLEDVMVYDELGGFTLILFVGRPWRSDAKDPLHFILQALFIGLFIHGPTWLSTEKTQ